MKRIVGEEDVKSLLGHFYIVLLEFSNPHLHVVGLVVAGGFSCLPCKLSLFILQALIFFKHADNLLLFIFQAF